MRTNGHRTGRTWSRWANDLEYLGGFSRDLGEGSHPLTTLQRIVYNASRQFKDSILAGRRKLLTPQGPQDWRIVFKQLSRGYCGLCHFDKRTIEVCNRLSDELTMQSLIHEAAHVALGEDYGEPAIERIEHNVYVALLPWLKQRFDIMED